MSTNSTAVVLAPEPEQAVLDQVERLKIWHENAVRCGKMAIMYALAVGAELVKAKKELPHGAFMHRYTEAGIKPDSASRYMRLAMEFRARNSNFALGEICEQDGTLKTSPDVMEKVVKIVDGRSLSQLYWEWGIKKSDGKTGGFKGGKKMSPDARRAANIKIARDAWTRITTSLLHELREESFRFLSVPEREDMIGRLDQAVKILRKNTK